MTKKIIWRLKETPNSENLRELVKDGILSKEEARQILFSEQDEVDRDIESFKSEIKFLRELVEKLSNSRSQIITTIKEIEVEKPIYYPKWSWYEPYKYYCGNDSNIALCTAQNNLQSTNFSDIKTF